jgi:hypothetical protein
MKGRILVTIPIKVLVHSLLGDGIFVGMVKIEVWITVLNCLSAV